GARLNARKTRIRAGVTGFLTDNALCRETMLECCGRVLRVSDPPGRTTTKKSGGAPPHSKTQAPHGVLNDGHVLECGDRFAAFRRLFTLRRLVLRERRRVHCQLIFFAEKVIIRASRR